MSTSANNQSNVAATLNIFTSKSAAQAVKTADQVMVSFKRNKTSNNPEAFQRAILLPQELLNSGNPVLDIAREIAAIEVLKEYCNGTSYDAVISANAFDIGTLDKKFVSMHEDSGSEWLTKEELQNLWNSSHTRKDFISRDLYQSNKEFQKAVALFEEKILSLAGKATQISQEWQDRILAKLHAQDIDSALGEFVTFRINKMRQKQKDDDILSML